MTPVQNIIINRQRKEKKLFCLSFSNVNWMDNINFSLIAITTEKMSLTAAGEEEVLRAMYALVMVVEC